MSTHAHLRAGIALLALIGSAGSAPRAAQSASTPIPLVQATQVGKTQFEPGDSFRGGNGQPIDGIEGTLREMLTVHVHAHLSIFYKGEQVAVPYGIGIVRPLRVENGFAGGNGFYWLHTHDATGIIHVESPDNRTYTLGNFFNIWGEPLSATNVAGLQGTVHAYVDGKPYSGDPRAIAIGAHTQITLEVGDPAVSPPVYLFPNGL